MKSFLTIGTLLLCIYCKAQTIDRAHLRCDYLMRICTDTTRSDTYAQEHTWLKVGRNASAFASEQHFTYDSLWCLNSAAARNAINLRPSRNLTCTIYKHYANGTIEATDKFGAAAYQYTEELPRFDWALLDDTKNILGYECRKATATFRGRDYTAWYAPDIAVSDGPWKLCGLPGLILEAYDDKGHYHFVAIGLRQISEDIVKLPRKYLTVSRAEHMEAYKRFLRNPLAAFAAKGITATSIDGEPLPMPEKQLAYDLIEKE